jgi:hypothetical protein
MWQDQAPQQRPTVGDTVAVVQRIAVAPGTLVEARAPTDTTLATLMGPPVVTREGDSVRIGYTLSVWAPGRNQLRIPGAITIAPDGTVDTLPDATVTLDVASVLPAGAVVESLTPQAARPWVERSESSGWPFLVILVPLLLIITIASWWWRRRGTLTPEQVRPAGTVREHSERMERWVAAGETSLAIDHLLTLLPDDDESAAWRAEVRAIRYDPAQAARLAELVQVGLAMHQRRSSR